jgi:hypothetical protein
VAQVVAVLAEIMLEMARLERLIQEEVAVVLVMEELVVVAVQEL